MKVIVTGGRGLVGAKFIAAYGRKYDFEQLGGTHETRVDITDRHALEDAINDVEAPEALVHLAAYTNVNGAYEQTGDKSGPAWQTNVIGTRNIAEVCAERGIYLIHLSTAYVFDGEKKEPYTEVDDPHPIEWYGRTKYESELEVQKSGAKAAILRIDQPFSIERSPKVDTLWRVIDGIQGKSLYPQFTNHFFGPTSIEQLANVLDFCLREQPTGLYHASSGESFSDYDFAATINDVLGFGYTVEKGDLDEYLQSNKRPYQRNTAMNTDKLQDLLDIELTPIRMMIQQVNLDKENHENR